MSDKSMRMEERLQNMKAFYMQVDDLIDKLPEVVPEKTKTSLKTAILGDKDLRKLMEGIEAHRPPRFFMIGRTGFGKSSLINALCDCYVAHVSDTRSCTECTRTYNCKIGNRVLMQICDTRGIAESKSVNPNVSAEQMIIDEMNRFSPDVAILMLHCTHRDDVDSDVKFVKELSVSYEEINKTRLPIVVVINKCDEMAPTTQKDPSNYPLSKISKIEEVVRDFDGIIKQNGLVIDNIIAVASLIEWQKPDGTYVDVDTINSMPISEVETLEIGFDGRYQIEDLFEILEHAILDFEAQMGFRMATRLKDVVVRLAKHLTSIFSTISATVALTPTPISDIKILLLLQATLVCMIASLSGRNISIETATEFILSLGGVTGAGFIFRTIAQQASKLANKIYPGAGSAISSGIAAFGTKAIGKAAISYYIGGTSVEDARKQFEAEKKMNSKAKE